jgi:hypothetical protein
MSADLSRVDALLQYSLLVAGEKDEPFERQLGPIHLIKYVYLADMFHAMGHNGSIYTGIEWKFHKFGPWSQSVNERIEPALRVINAEQRIFESNYEEKDDWTRWMLRDERTLHEKETEIPSAITIHLRRMVLKFGKETPGLLHYVYSTKPMLNAAPNEFLDFQSVVIEGKTSVEGTKELKIDSLSNKKKKKLKENMRGLQERQKQRTKKNVGLINPVKKPRYDDIYSDGIAWLDGLAGVRILDGEQIVEFSDDIWKSDARKGEDVP